MGKNSKFTFHTGILRKGRGRGEENNNNNNILIDVDDWIREKRFTDGAEGLWRIHDKLYDFSNWISNHPGGKHWLEETKGTDITEAFECSHISRKPEQILEKFYVKSAETKRNCLITFHENGFYKILKNKIIRRQLVEGKSREPQFKTKLLADSLALTVFLTGLLGTIWKNHWFLLISGIFLSMLTVCAHNFLHMKNNWRIYYFQLSLMSVREWRISHVLSHHIYPNSSLDLEVTMVDPFLNFLPKPDKMYHPLSWILSPFVMAAMFHYQLLRRILKKKKSINRQREEVVVLALPLFLYIFSGKGIWMSLIAWNVIVATGSLFFGLIGFSAAHHHPEIYHDGDYLGDDKDFGIVQLAAVRNRRDVDGNFFFTMIMFGEHALHHLFPTIDHSQLHKLDHVLEETCDEFKLDFKPFIAGKLFLGMFQQLARNYTNATLKLFSNQ